MGCILLLETSTTVCSVALSAEGMVVFEKVSFDGPSHAALLGVFVEEAIAFSHEKKYRPDAVAVSGGPGSYTGLRIGTSMAKGLCMGWGIPLIAIPTLDIMAAKVVRRMADHDSLYCSMLDARRMEVYAAVYDAALTVVRETAAEIVIPETYGSFPEKKNIYFFGNGAAKCKDVITSGNAFFLDDIHPLAADMAPLAEQAYRAKRFEDVAYYVPFYLKDFVATTPKNKVLGDL